MGRYKLCELLQMLSKLIPSQKCESQMCQLSCHNPNLLLIVWIYPINLHFIAHESSQNTPSMGWKCLVLKAVAASLAGLNAHLFGSLFKLGLRPPQ